MLLKPEGRVVSGSEARLDDSAYLSRLLTHMATRSIVSDNTLFQLAIALARISLEPNEPEYELDLARTMYACLMNRPEPASNVVDLAAFRASSADRPLPG